MPFLIFLEAEIFGFKRTFSPAFAFISPFHYEDIGSIGARLELFGFIRRNVNVVFKSCRLICYFFVFKRTNFGIGNNPFLAVKIINIESNWH